MAAKRNLSTFDVASMLEVDPGSVANWIDSGLLKAHRTPGGHRRVAASDLLDFLREHDMPVPGQLEIRPTRVVVVDDEPAMTQMISRAIRAQHPDYEVAEAHDGFRAGAIIATLKPDVVILDLRMPGMDGFEVCQMIKSQEATRHAAVISVTAYPSEESSQRILSCGAKTCLPKPLDLSELVTEVESAIEAVK
ncbi:MAG TPA: response regulator [Phycisphaerae bacterium]|nr:response regulator [Phycisphaerae bacterium]